MPRIAVAFLVDPRGHVLLQHRDEHAPQAPNQWGLVGGHVEPGEDFDTACTARSSRRPASAPAPVTWCSGRTPSSSTPTGAAVHYRVYAGRVDLTDDDIVLGEGRAIVFVDPAEFGNLDLAESCAHFLPLFLASDLYRQFSAEGKNA